MKYLYYRTHRNFEYAYCEDMLITIQESTDVAHRKPFVEIRTEVSDKFRRMFDTRSVEITEPEFFAMRVRAAELIGIAKLTCLMCGEELDSVCSTACREAFDETLEEEVELTEFESQLVAVGLFKEETEFPGEIKYMPKEQVICEDEGCIDYHNEYFNAPKHSHAKQEVEDVAETDGRGMGETPEPEHEG